MLQRALRALALALVRLYYPRRQVLGMEHLPAADRTGTPVLLAANHPNGLLDPLLLALVVLLAGSLLNGCAWDIGSLVTFRVVQGVGAGLMLPIMQTLVVRAAGGRALGRSRWPSGVSPATSQPATGGST